MIKNKNMKHLKNLWLAALVAGALWPLTATAAPVDITLAGGWLETAYVEWALADGVSGYHVYVAAAEEAEAAAGAATAATTTGATAAEAAAWTRLDSELVRRYPTFGRADALGLKAGSYRLKVVPLDADGKEIAADAAETADLEVRAHDRTGFAHHGRGEAGVGAYRNDGTLRDSAIVLYVNARNASTLSVTWMLEPNKGKMQTYTGLQTIIDGYRKCLAKGSPLPALCIRVVGLVKASDMDTLLSSEEGFSIKANKKYGEMPLTLEGVGCDATLWGMGIHVCNAVGVEVRNLGIMLCMDDALSISQYNAHCWFHHNDLFYGQTGSASDQKKGDGSIDIKLSQRCTVAYNHLYDCGKSCLIDAKSLTSNYANQLTYHHNWFDHSDSRHPRCRNGNSFHIYNNYYDGIGLYGVGLACNSSAFVEGNYFRACRYPVIASGQGTDLNLVNAGQSKKGLLSGENGGIAKWWNNYTEGATSLVTQLDGSSTGFDVYAVSSRAEQVPASVVTVKGGVAYSNFDTDSSMYVSAPDDPLDVPAIVTGAYGAGRCQHGDFTWTFDNATQDTNQSVITALKTALEQYHSSLVGYFDGTVLPNGPTSSLSAIPADSAPSVRYYDLLGRPVGDHYAGLVVTRGKKILVKP